MADVEDSGDLAPRLICPSINFPAVPPSIAHRYDAPLSYFLSIPWCASHLNSPDTHPYLPTCRNPPMEGGPVQDRFFSTVLTAPGGLQHMLSFFRCPPAQLRDPKHIITEVSTFASLGKSLTGVPDILHGGVTMALADEAMSQVIEVNTALKKDGTPFTGLSVTGTLECKFLKGVPAEGVIMATARLEGTERRKTRVICEVVNEKGEKFASIKSVWISLGAKI